MNNNSNQTETNKNELTKEKLLELLRELKEHNDPEHAHGLADKLIIQFINDKEISKAYTEIEKWYA